MHEALAMHCKLQTPIPQPTLFNSAEPSIVSSSSDEEQSMAKVSTSRIPTRHLYHNYHNYHHHNQPTRPTRPTWLLTPPDARMPPAASRFCYCVCDKKRRKHPGVRLQLFPKDAEDCFDTDVGVLPKPPSTSHSLPPHKPQPQPPTT
ncbi:hypothetical protein GWK47_021869 [Chionoecetes opilio]|uniref:Uncharacterized protein n=1 Tax=Chionoecetes opilio TaxID=41210 RepID=A0A8J5CE38_CHIOP|nr:hypothetical protein GWK47_021869 [Chionoecetes opilio]